MMHGGLFSEDGVTLDDLRKIERNRQPPDSGGFTDEIPNPSTRLSKSLAFTWQPAVVKHFCRLDRHKSPQNHPPRAAGVGFMLSVISTPHLA